MFKRAIVILTCCILIGSASAALSQMGNTKDPGGTYNPAIDRQNQQIDRDTMNITDKQINQAPKDMQDQLRKDRNDATRRQTEHMMQGTMK